MRTILRWVFIIAVIIGACVFMGYLIDNYELWERAFAVFGGATVVVLIFGGMLWMFFEE